MFETALQMLPRGDGRSYRPTAPVAIPGHAAAYDLTASSLSFAASTARDGDPLIRKTIGAGIALDDQTQNPASPTAGTGRGWFTLTLAHADTAGLRAVGGAPTVLYWSLKLADAAYEDATLCSGTLQVQAAPTS